MKKLSDKSERDRKNFPNLKTALCVKHLVDRLLLQVAVNKHCAKIKIFFEGLQKKL